MLCMIVSRHETVRMSSIQAIRQGYQLLPIIWETPDINLLLTEREGHTGEYWPNFGKISIFLFSSDSFNLKNDIIHTFFPLFWLQILNLPASLQNKNTRIGPFPWKWSVLQNHDRERTNQSTGICLRLGLPYNNEPYCSVSRLGSEISRITAEFCHFLRYSTFM